MAETCSTGAGGAPVAQMSAGPPTAPNQSGFSATIRVGYDPVSVVNDTTIDDGKYRTGVLGLARITFFENGEQITKDSGYVFKEIIEIKQGPPADANPKPVTLDEFNTIRDNIGITVSSPTPLDFFEANRKHLRPLIAIPTTTIASQTIEVSKPGGPVLFTFTNTRTVTNVENGNLRQYKTNGTGYDRSYYSNFTISITTP